MGRNAEPESGAEFDHYAKEYASLLQDPVRDLFTTDGEFFQRRKWDLLRAELRRRGLDSSGAEWLDVGCGKGELLALGRRSFRRATGCDPSAEMIRGNPELVWQSDPLHLPFGDASFDLVTAVCVYHHVPLHERPILTREIFRVLRPGGTVCFIEHNSLNPVTQWIVSRTPVDAGAVLASHWRMRALARAAGFHKSRTEFFLYLPERLYGRAGWLEKLLAGLPFGGQYALFCVRPRKLEADKRTVHSLSFVLA